MEGKCSHKYTTQLQIANTTVFIVLSTWRFGSVIAPVLTMTSYQYVQLQNAKRELTYLAVLPAIVGYILYLMENQQGLKVAAKVNSVYQSEKQATVSLYK